MYSGQWKKLKEQQKQMGKACQTPYMLESVIAKHSQESIKESNVIAYLHFYHVDEICYEGSQQY